MALRLLSQDSDTPFCQVSGTTTGRPAGDWVRRFAVHPLCCRASHLWPCNAALEGDIRWQRTASPEGDDLEDLGSELPFGNVIITRETGVAKGTNCNLMASLARRSSGTRPGWIASASYNSVHVKKLGIRTATLGGTGITAGEAEGYTATVVVLESLRPVNSLLGQVLQRQTWHPPW